MIHLILSSFLFLYIFFLSDFPAMAKDKCFPLFWGVAVDGYPINPSTLKSIENETHISPQIVVFFLQWPMSPKEIFFSESSLDAIWNTGAIPCLTWEPMYYEKDEEKMIPHQKILKGDYDPYITEVAKKVKGWGKMIIIRFAHEMNTKRYHWGTDIKGYGADSPKIYKQLFLHVVSIFKTVGANQALWAFCPNVESVPDTSHEKHGSWNEIKNYYPGDEYVDILGMDGYNWGTTQTIDKNGWKSDWKEFKDIFSPIYHTLKTVSPGKPIIIFETASASQGGNRSAWVKGAFDALKDWDIQGIVWFHVKKEIDWRINSNELKYLEPLIRTYTSSSQRWINRNKNK